jgi:tetratricopeptide (TPR) repeat protein
VREFATIRRFEARKLVRVATTLAGIADFDGAERYAAAALAAVPDAADAQALLATAREHRPDPSATKAAGLVALGRAHEARGAFDQATDYYAQALQEQPADAGAQAALGRVLQARHDLAQRYQALAIPTCRWLALELARDSLLSARRRRFPWPVGAGAAYAAQVHNFIGTLYQASAWRLPDQLHDQAIQSFELAIAGLGCWFQPHENLAFSYSAQGKWLKMLGRADQNRRLQDRAVASYRAALERLDSLPWPADVPRPSDAELRVIRRRIGIGLATALLHAGDEQDRQAAEHQRATALAGWIPEDEREDWLLYNVASWYGVAHAQRPADLEYWRAGRRLLGYSLVRQSEQSGVGADPDLRTLTAGLEDFRYAVRRRLRARPDLPRLTGQPFSDEVQARFAQTQWLIPVPGRG